MGYADLVPRSVDTTGASCTGGDGTANRTYVLPEFDVISGGMVININGTTLHHGSGNDYTLSGSTITFLNIVDNTDIIRINYFTGTGTSEPTTLTSDTLRYSTVNMLCEILGIKKDVPSWDIGSSPSNEEVGTGDDSETLFYLDHKCIIPGTYTLYYGADASATDELTETTHYSLDMDTGKITLTSAGVTLVSTNKIFASYSYITNGMQTSYLTSVLNRAEIEVDKTTNSYFTDSSGDNPSYPQETEVQSTNGAFNNQWITNKKPVIDVVSALDGDITSSDTTISLTSGTGPDFPSSGYIIVGSEVIKYTGTSSDDLTGVSRGQLGTTAAAHSDGDAVHTTIVFVSDTAEGTAETFTVQPWDTSVYVTEDGLITRFKDADPDTLSALDVPNRFKIIYYYGNATVPKDITRLALLFAKRMLVTDAVGNALVGGRDEFQPEMINADREEINRIVDSYIVLPMGNT